MCMISVSALWLCLRDTVLELTTNWKSRLRDSGVEHNMHGVMRIGKMVNGKVMNYDLRDLDNEMNKSLNFYLNKTN